MVFLFHCSVAARLEKIWKMRKLSALTQANVHPSALTRRKFTHSKMETMCSSAVGSKPKRNSRKGNAFTSCSIQLIYFRWHRILARKHATQYRKENVNENSLFALILFSLFLNRMTQAITDCCLCFSLGYAFLFRKIFVVFFFFVLFCFAHTLPAMCQLSFRCAFTSVTNVAFIVSWYPVMKVSRIFPMWPFTDHLPTITWAQVELNVNKWEATAALLTCVRMCGFANFSSMCATATGLDKGEYFLRIAYSLFFCILSKNLISATRFCTLFVLEWRISN